MQEILNEYYLWIRAFHVISVIAWMAGLLYLPRLFIYHIGFAKESSTSDVFKLMERRLLRLIMNPAMISTWIFGVLMIMANPSLFENGWMHVKFTCVVLMTIIHMVFAYHRKQFEKGSNKKTTKYYRWINEVPTLLMIVIVIMAIVNPF